MNKRRRRRKKKIWRNEIRTFTYIYMCRAIRDECVMINKNKGTRNTLVNYASRMHLIKALRQQDCANRFFQNVHVYYISSQLLPFSIHFDAHKLTHRFRFEIEDLRFLFVFLFLSSLNRKRGIK